VNPSLVGARRSAVVKISEGRNLASGVGEPLWMKAKHHRAFALRELVTIGALAGAAAALFVPLAASAGGGSRMSVCMSRLKSISMSTARYGADHRDALASLQSRVGQTVTYGKPGLDRTVTYRNIGTEEIRSVADQAVDIIRRRGNRSDIEPIGSSWLAPPTMSHLALSDYEQEPLPSSRWACPEDATLVTWQSDPMNYNNMGVPSPPGPGALTNAEKRWPYISSYQRGTYTWSPDRRTDRLGTWAFAGEGVYVRGGAWTPNRGDLGYRSLSDVANPSSKIYLWDRGARHFTPTAVYWNFAGMKQPMMYFDGASRTTLTNAIRPGWDPLNPDRATTIEYSYAIFSVNETWRPGFPDGSPFGSAEFPAARQQTTREGLAGRDLGITGVTR
jgi:hypothetical protein